MTPAPSPCYGTRMRTRLAVALVLAACTPRTVEPDAVPAAASGAVEPVSTPTPVPSVAPSDAPKPPEPAPAVVAVDEAAPQLRIEGVPVVPADPAVTTCTGRTPQPGQRLREVNLCDLLEQDAERALRGPARYELVSARYADLRPTWSSGDATLCAGEEAVLVVLVHTEGAPGPRECLQLRCESSFPPDPVRVGKNGELCRSTAGTFEGWSLSPGRVEARFAHGVDVWTLKEVGEDYAFERR